MSTVYVSERRPSPTLGLQLDRAPWEVDGRAFVTMRNVRTFKNALQTIGGKSLIATTADAKPVTLIGLPTFFSNYQIGVVGTSQHLYSLEAGVLTALNAADYGGTDGDPWEMAMLLNNAYFMLPGEPIQVMTEGLVVSALAASAGVVPKGRTMTDYYNHLIVGNILDPAPSNIDFMGSGLADATFWNTVDLTRESRRLIVSTGNNPIQCIRRLGDYIMVYKTFSVHVYSYLPQVATIYGGEVLRTRTGVVGPYAVCYVPGQRDQNDVHIFVGQDNIYRNDGSVQAIGERIWDDFKSKVYPQTWRKIINFYHEAAKEVYFGFASATGDGTIDTALVYDLEYDNFSYRDWPFRGGGYALNPATADKWSDHPEAWTAILPAGRPWVTVSGLEDMQAYVGGPAGQVYQYEGTPTGDFDATLQTGLWDGGDDGHLKRCNGMRMDIQGITAATPLEIWGRGLYEIDEYNTAAFRRLATMTGGSQVFFDLTGRWFDFRFIQRAGGTFRITYFEPRFKQAGER